MTIHDQPEDITPAFNDVSFVVSDTNYASANFKYIAEVKNGSGTSLAKLKAPIFLGSTDKGVFNIQRILESYVSYDFSLTQGHEDCPNSVFKYEVEFGYEYGSTVTEYTNITSITNHVWNGGLTRRAFNTYASGEFLLQSGSTDAKFLTTKRGKNIRVNQWDYLYFLSRPTPLAFYLQFARYRSYDSAGSLLKTVDCLDLSGGSTGNYYVTKIPSGRNTAQITDIISGTAPVVHAAAAYYTIQIYDNSNNALTEAFRYTIDDTCTRHDTIILYFLNSLGGFDSFCFDLRSDEKINVTRKQMRRNTFELSGTTYGDNLSKHSLANFDNTYIDTLKLNSDWLTDSECEHLKELVSSPVVFLQYYGDSFYTPVTVTRTDWDIKIAADEELFNAEIEVQFDMERRQNG